MKMKTRALDIENLKVLFPTPGGIVKAVEGVDLFLEEGECLALVGESGCGKSVTARAALRLLDESVALQRSDKHILCGEDVRNRTSREMENLLGKEASIVFQDALTALNPVVTVGKQIDEVLLRHMGMNKDEAKTRTIELLSMVGVPEPQSRYKSYPHELSGGMRQRVLIAMAFACEPKLIVADEPTTALDVTIQAQVLLLLSKMQREHQTSLLLISHDLSVVSWMADRIAVMYCGKIVEIASREELFKNPLHPYTKGLLSSVVRIDDDSERFSQIPGFLPDPTDKPSGCYFNPRCSYKTNTCIERQPPLIEVNNGHYVRCPECLKIDDRMKIKTEGAHI